MRSTALALSREGLGQAAIARRLKVNVRTVRRWARRDGWRDMDLAALSTPDPLARARALRASALEAAETGELDTARKSLAEARRLDKLARDLDSLRATARRPRPEDMSDDELVAAVKALLGED
jgi:uncharacterized protein YjcR